MCRFSRLGRSNAFEQTSQGNKARSPRVGRAFGDARGMVIDVSIKSPALLAADDDDVDDSPDTDLCSSSPPDGGEMGNITRDNNDIDKSSGDSVQESKSNGKYFEVCSIENQLDGNSTNKKHELNLL